MSKSATGSRAVATGGSSMRSTWRPPHNRRRAVIRSAARATGTVDQAEASAFGHEERVGVMVHGATVSRWRPRPDSEADHEDLRPGTYGAMPSMPISDPRHESQPQQAWSREVPIEVVASSR